MKKLERWILHPFLFGIYPVMALLAHNIRQIAPVYAFRAFLLSGVLALVVLLLFRIILMEWRRAALITSFAVLLFFSYGQIFEPLQHVHLLGVDIGRHRVLLVVAAMLLVTASWLILKKLSLPTWTMALNVMSVIAVSLTLVQILWYEVRTAIVSQVLPPPATTAADLGLHLPEGKTPPDIYYIILDMYTRQDAMQINLGYDNSPFLSALEQRGFFVATCSQSNYPSTYPSLTSSLNMNYLSTLSKDFSPPNKEIDDLYPFLQENAVRLALKNLGYKIVGFESGFSPDQFQDADYYFSPQNDIWGELTLGGLNPLESILMQNSAGLVLYDYSLSHPTIRPFFDYSYITFRNRMLFEMDKLPDLTSIPGPKFTFVHLIAPHNPFAFGPNGEVIVRQTPFTLNNDRDAQAMPDFTRGYIGEVTYLDERFLSIVDQIMKKSATPPIIIIQGDHGIPRIPKWNMANLNVYYLPEGGEQNLYPSISPVNSFRVIFNTYFGAHLNLLKDQACNSASNDPYACPVLADPNPQCSVAGQP
jgi:hypothetical protein